MTARDLITTILLPAGAAFSALGALGLVTFPHFLARLHAAAKPQTVGVVLVLAGTAPQLETLTHATPLLLVALFQITTAPVVAHAVGLAAYRAGVATDGKLLTDELARALGTDVDDQDGNH